MILKKRKQHNGTFIFSFSIINSNNFNMGREIMRIPINSTFTKEVSKKFKRIFNPQTTFEEIQNLQEESYMGSHVDNFLKEVLKKENDNGQKTSKVARTVRQVHNKRTRLVKEAVSNQGKKKSSGLEITSS
jgi:hypothetical protein